MLRGTRVDDPALPVVLSESAMLEKARELAQVMGEVEQLEVKLAAIVKREKKAINERLATAQRLAQQIRNQEEFRDQSTLKFDEDPTKGEAQNALAEVGAIVEGPKTEEFDENNPPTGCPKCGKPVKPLMAGLTCEDSAEGGTCDWIARPAGKTLAGEPLIEKPAEGACAICNGSGIVLTKAEGEEGPGVESPCSCATAGGEVTYVPDGAEQPEGIPSEA